MNQAYSEKLRDPRWQKKRLQVLERDNFTCQFCGNTEKTLHIHHFCYPQSGNPWDSHLTSLTTLCCDCHQVEHSKDLSDKERRLVDLIQTIGMMDCKNSIISYLVKDMNRILLR